jgi:hypothetical protein
MIWDCQFVLQVPVEHRLPARRPGSLAMLSSGTSSGSSIHISLFLLQMSIHSQDVFYSERFLLVSGHILSLDAELLYSGNEARDQKVTLALYFKGKLI